MVDLNTGHKNPSLWTAVDEYAAKLLLPPDSLLEEVLRVSEAAGLPKINVSACQGKQLQLLAQFGCARRILEIGTLGGYSTIWLARALPADGRLVSLELEPSYAKIARANVEQAGFGALVEIREGPALDSLSRLVEEHSEPFDFIFIDADKPGYPQYFDWSLRLSRKGTMIVADNVVREGAVVDGGSGDENVQGVRRFLELVAGEPSVSATVIQTVGSKGYDGFAVVMVLEDSRTG